MTLPKLDLVKDRRDLYRPSVKEPVLVEVPEMSFLMVDGQGDPNTAPEYAHALNALYAVSYGVKFAVTRSGGLDFKGKRKKRRKGTWTQILGSPDRSATDPSGSGRAPPPT